MLPARVLDLLGVALSSMERILDEVSSDRAVSSLFVSTMGSLYSLANRLVLCLDDADDLTPLPFTEEAPSSPFTMLGVTAAAGVSLVAEVTGALIKQKKKEFKASAREKKCTSAAVTS